MTLTAGTRIGPYEISVPLGAGGMGEVYRARDSRLGRDVAIKVIPAAFATDPDRLLRFQQEATAAASLNHPNIVVVHDLGTHDGAPYIVTEVLEGQTLREALAVRSLSVRAAIDYASQLARGLAAAHEKGIVHRDLKPENIFITSDNRVKILDFGLAKLTQVDVAGLGVSTFPTSPGVAHAPVATTPGLVLGTVGYMAPEQVRGTTVDHRADIFALGAILYEMLTGRRAFRGESAIDTMTAILRDDPPEPAPSGSTLPSALNRIIEHCLEKNPELRFQSARDVAFALEALSGTSHAVTPDVPVIRESSRRSLTRWRIATAAVALLAGAMIPAVVAHWRERPTQAALARLSLELPATLSLTQVGVATPWLEVSPDGRYIAFRASSSTQGETRLWLRALDGTTIRSLTPSQNIQSFFWAPDSRSIAFASDGVLRTVSIDGGAAQTVARVPGGTTGAVGGTWSETGTILIGGARIYRVPAQGGAFVPVTPADPSATAIFPIFLPDGRRFLFSKLGGGSPGLYLASLDDANATQISSDSVQPRLAGDVLFFSRGQSVMAQRFDINRGRPTGDAYVVADDVSTNAANGRAAYAVVDSGPFVFATAFIGRSQFRWFTRSGQPGAVVTEPAPYYTVHMAPDGKKFVYARREINGGNRSLWVTDVVRGVTSRLTFGDYQDSDGTWSPDMSRIAYASIRQGDKSLYVIPSNGGVEKLLLKSDGRAISIDAWSPDGKTVLYHMDAAREMWALPLDGGKPFAVVKPLAGRVPDEVTFSPDGKWIAYNSDESGRFEVYLAPFPTTGARWQVSSAGGVQPTWRSDGRELFFLAVDGSMMAADIHPSISSVELGTPHLLFKTDLNPSGAVDQYAVAPDGRFLMMSPIAGEVEPSPIVLLNWRAVLDRR